MTHHLKPPALISFLNSLAFGVIAPPLYYMIALPFSDWIALLFVVEILGRFFGQSLGEFLTVKFGRRFTLAGTQAVNAFSYLLLIVVGILRPTVALGFTLIYISRFFGAIASANLPSVRPINPDRTGNQGILTAQVGFAIGCLFTAILANHHPVPDSILVTGGLLIPAIIAAAISLFTTVIASLFVNLRDVSWQIIPLTTDFPMLRPTEYPIALLIMLACESAFAMILCVLPLTQREILAFSPATLAIFFATLALISAVSARWTTGRPRSLPIALNIGMLLSAIGFFGFSYALWLSWRYEKSDGVARAMRTMWIAGVPAAIGHGLLRAALPWARAKSGADRTDGRKSIFFDAATTIVAIVSVIFVGRIWLAHERASLAIPGAILLLALPMAAVLIFSIKRDEAREFPVHP